MVPLLTPISPLRLPQNNKSSSNNGDSINDHHEFILSNLNQCRNISQLKQIHAYTLRTTNPLDSRTLFLHSKMLHFSAFHDFNYSSRFLNSIENPNTFVWNALIRACAHNVSRKEEAILLFNRILEKDLVKPDKHTFTFVLKSCAYLFALSEGKQLHCQILKHGFGEDVYINNGLIHLYGSCGCLDLAQKVFDEMPERSVVSWNAMIDALVQLGEFDSGLDLFRKMQKAFKPDGYTMQSVISACAGIGSLSLGFWAHAFLLRHCDHNKLADDVLIANSLIKMYCKCGSLKMTKQVFEGMQKRDITSWNSLILGLAMHGRAEVALDCFEQMVRIETFKPNSITFVGVLSACNHKGMVKEGRELFDTMVKEYGIKPGLEHYGCMVDLLARAGFIEESLELVSSMPMKPDVVIWRSLLDACSKKGAGIELSEEMALQILETEGENGSGVYVLLSRVYASARRWNEVGLIRKVMTDRGIAKEPGCSSIEIKGVTHEFFAGDTSHPETEQIYQKLNLIDETLQLFGYSPDSSQAPLIDDLDEGKAKSLRLHSERLAISYGLIHSEPGIPIRVFKNLRVCNDCHEVSKLISKIFNVEIVVRDRARFHHFKDGSCSCLDYW